MLILQLNLFMISALMNTFDCVKENLVGTYLFTIVNET